MCYSHSQTVLLLSVYNPAGAAGAVAASVCVLCIAGTYQTGSGRVQRLMLS
jgi:hypothetical protein